MLPAWYVRAVQTYPCYSYIQDDIFVWGEEEKGGGIPVSSLFFVCVRPNPNPNRPPFSLNTHLTFLPS